MGEDNINFNNQKNDGNGSTDLNLTDETRDLAELPNESI